MGDALLLVAERAVSDAAFRARAREDLEGALAQEGLVLEADELEAVRELNGMLAGLSDAELTEALRRQGPALIV